MQEPASAAASRTALVVMVAAGSASAATVAFDTAGRAVRDALFLAQFGARALPQMVVAGSLVALIAGVVASRVMARTAPVPFLLRALAFSAVGFALEWSLIGRFVEAISVAVYVHFTAMSGLFISGFWTVVSERFDPRTARRSVARIAAAGTAGGLLGGVLAERIAATGSIATMLLVLGALNVAAAIAIHALRPTALAALPTSGAHEASAPRIRALIAVRYVQLLLAIVILGAIAETCLDFVFMTRANAAFSDAESLLRVFAAFYTAAALLTMIVQLTLTRRLVQVLGLAPAAATLPAGVAFGGAAALLWPTLGGAIAARGTELVLRNSIFRSAYELLCNAMPPRQKRAAKTLIDVTAVRFGRIVGSVLIQVTLIVAAIQVLPIVLGVTIAVSVFAVALLPLLKRGHLGALESHLVSRAPAAADRAAFDTGFFPVMSTDELLTMGTFAAPPADADEGRREALESGDPPRVREALQQGPLTPELAADVVPLLGWEPVLRDAYRALEMDVDVAMPALVATLRDRSVSFPIRRRVTLLLGGVSGVSGRDARDALVEGLRDPRFEIRYRCGRALTRLVATDPALAPTPDAILAVVSREVDVDRRVWDDRHLAMLLPDEGPRALLGEVLQERTDRSLEHVFGVLALCLPAEPLLAAFRGLESGDPHLRGTALDYLEFIVPPEIRRKLWRILEGEPHARGATRVDETTGAVKTELDDLLREQYSIALRVEELRRERAVDGDEKPLGD